MDEEDDHCPRCFRVVDVCDFSANPCPRCEDCRDTLVEDVDIDRGTCPECYANEVCCVCFLSFCYVVYIRVCACRLRRRRRRPRPNINKLSRRSYKRSKMERSLSEPELRITTWRESRPAWWYVCFSCFSFVLLLKSVFMCAGGQGTAPEPASSPASPCAAWLAR